MISVAMAELPQDIAELVAGEKVLGDAPIWDEASDPRYVVFTHSLTVGEPPTGGFQLRAKVSKRWADRDALLQLEYAPAGRRSEVPLWRLDWKPFHTHDNKGWPPDVPWESFPRSHQHPFADNFKAEARRMRGSNLPAARAFPSDPNTLSDFLALGGELFRIKDIRKVSLPVIGEDLFWSEA